MKVAIIGSRSLTVDDLAPFVPEGTTELISGGAKGIDTCVRRYAEQHGIPLTEHKPDYARYKKAAPIIRNARIIMDADEIVALWDGMSRGTERVIRDCALAHKKVTVLNPSPDDFPYELFADNPVPDETESE